MRASTWLERMHDSLRENGIPQRYRVRFMEELHDHLSDLQEANMDRSNVSNFDLQMGEPKTLANALADAYFRERRLVRQPWLAVLAFALAPIPLHWLLTFVVLVPVVSLVVAFGADFEAFVPFAYAISAMVAAGGVSTWFCLAAQRNRLSWRMSLLAALAVTGSLPVLLFLDGPLLATDSVLLTLVSIGLAGAAALATWYLLAWRKNRWQEKPISLSTRFPMFTHGMIAVLVVSICLIAHLVSLEILLGVLEYGVGRPRVAPWVSMLGWSCRYVPFVLASYLMWRFAQRCKRPLVGSLSGCFVVACLAAITFANIVWTADGTSECQFGMGVGFLPSWAVFLQFSAPLAIWGLLMVASRLSTRIRLA